MTPIMKLLLKLDDEIGVMRSHLDHVEQLCDQLMTEIKEAKKGEA